MGEGDRVKRGREQRRRGSLRYTEKKERTRGEERKIERGNMAEKERSVKVEMARAVREEREQTSLISYHLKTDPAFVPGFNSIQFVFFHSFLTSQMNVLSKSGTLQ